MDKYFWRRLLRPGKFRQIFVERLTEPLHLNVISLFVALFGSYRWKVDFDLVIRQQYAFPLLYAAERARRYGISRITVLEFGVANGAGLLNMCRLAERTRKATGINFRVVGFDTGTGMPAPLDYRDLPDTFQQGDFPMDVDRLRSALPNFAELAIGDVKDTIPQFLKTVSADAPIGFVSVDVDYYSSARECLKVLTGRPQQYLPVVPVYLDDIALDSVNPWTGELLAINEFNQQQDERKIAPFTLLRSERIFKNIQWIDRMYAAHIHDHRLRSPAARRARKWVMSNEYA